VNILKNSAGSDNVRLRATTERDLDLVLRIESAPENAAFIGQWSRERHRAAIDDPGKAHWLVLAEPDECVVGYLILVGIDSPHRSLEITRIAITEKGKGFGRQALRLVKRWAFEEAGAHRLWLDVMENNHRARHLYRSEGFVEEATLRESIAVGDRFVSLVILSILEDEYCRTGPSTVDLAPQP
jgi:RimJ/RimL family protein N-acetyltransferase